jgi:Restriction endonuclease BsobI
MRKRDAYRTHLSCSDALVTSKLGSQGLFASLCLERERRMLPILSQAKALKSALKYVRRSSDLRVIPALNGGLLVASGLSAQIKKSVTRECRDALLSSFIYGLNAAGTNFVEEFVFRFLITRGDTLGGSMRNVGGACPAQVEPRNNFDACAVWHGLSLVAFVNKSMGERNGRRARR